MANFNKIKLLFISFILAISSYGQSYEYAFLVEFTDKNNTKYNVENPLEFLSQKAINRRQLHNVEISEQDFPVNYWYVDSIKNFNAVLHVTSRWFNSAVFKTNSKAFLSNVRNVSFVKNVQLVYQRRGTKKTSENKFNETNGGAFYGHSFNQVAMCNAHKMHEQNLRGQGVHIAVLDAGFYKVDKLFAFDSLWMNNQIVYHWDFVNGKSDVFESHSHGLMVLSTLAGNIPGEIVGTAPKAFYSLYRTEDGSSEFPIEEENWIAAAEHADSAGVDIISTSLGYSVYDLDELSYTYSDMDGQTARITRGSEIAFSKGILLVTSAGNEGNKPWRHITAPSDAPNVLCVGAVDQDQIIADFSSVGPAADGRIKPDVVAQGANASIINSDGLVVEGDGTSFSCPIMAGMMACMWQALPNYTNKQILNLVKSYGEKHSQPNNIYGNGLPNFNKLFFTLDSINAKKPNANSIDNLNPNPFFSNFSFRLYIKNEQIVQIRLISLQGKNVWFYEQQCQAESFNLIDVENNENLPNGYYTLQVITNEGLLTKKIVKL